ncbi:glycosyltransferase [Paenibacillus sp. D2_2]|uniref:glycosyltransferase n=1 Tax=Paenibacillus sp. D2_2 TaxID=3073092 RepID=UPI002814F14D|nr:glycosyltransferase [Paenibacillus sp. D2_2]WMT39298.1 glycosyltransferase [Paenibacillus sp. D2_2]
MFESVEMTIVYPPALDWNLLFQRPQQLMTSFSKIPGVRAIFLNEETYKKQYHPIEKLNDDLFLVRKGVSYDHLVKGKKVLWFSSPGQYNYRDGRKFDFVVFDYLDNSADEFAIWKNYIPKCFARANLVATTARVMYEEHKNDGKPIFLCPNGADYEHFKKAQMALPKPPDFPHVEDGQKVVGFHGAMASWVDYWLITDIANLGHRVVLIGNNSLYKKQINHPNITCLPHKDYKVLPAYLAQFDVCMVPFKLTEMIRGCDPIKYYEYLSAGKPVLTTRMEEIVNKYSDVTYFIDRRNCRQMIDKALKENSPAKIIARTAVARENSWDRRALDAIKMINKVMGGGLVNEKTSQTTFR